jgi:hypothetical protein
VKSPILIAAALLSGAALAALAADPPKDAPKELTPQQQRMSDCSKASKGLKGDEHKKFMSDCLKKDSTIDVSKPAVSAGAGSKPDTGKTDTGKTGAGKTDTGKTDTGKTDTGKTDGKTAQQEKMKTCNADADKDKLKGDARKKFMSDCLKGGSATAAAEPPKAEPPKKETQQEKMKSCNALADKDKLKGDDRKKFMSDCLKGAA